MTVTYASAPPPPPPPPPSTSAVGPQSTITCPAGAVDIWPGVSIQNVVNSYGGNTTFCLQSRHPFSAELDHAEDREYVCRRVRRGPGRHRLDDERRHAGARSGRTTKTSTT